ncbi:MAG: response regulator transcription factor [Methyloprofundus sp.]|nr:response regulator transcription factor [Methyloprofundus sp.]
MKTALLVEDYSPIRELLMDVLQHAFVGIEVKEAENLDQALQWTQQQTFSIALIDLNLPDGSGIDLIVQIREDHPQTFIVVATVFDDDHNLFAALEAGAHGYILKEESRGKLINLLEGIIQGNPPLSAGIARRLIRYFNNTPEKSKDPYQFSPREKEVLRLITEGKQRKEIARELNISVHTTSDYIKVIYRKLNVSSRSEAAIKAAKLRFP